MTQNTTSVFFPTVLAAVVIFACLFSQRQTTAQTGAEGSLPPGSPVVATATPETPTPQLPQLPLGWATEKPVDGLSVEVDGKFMVAYTMTIPGTDVEIKMVPIPGGSFLMGSGDTDAPDDVTPQIEVTVEPFWMGQYEVNWAQYQSYMAMDAAFKKMAKDDLRIVTSAETEIDAVTAPSSLYEPDITYEAGEDADQPAASMTQFAAKQYTKWLSLLTGDFYRLPYESEWEYACRAGTTTKYYFGDDDEELDQHGWHYDVSDDLRHPCGELKPNPWGLYDMYGNVSEWVLDGYTENGYDAIAGKSLTTQEAFQKPAKVFPRVLRGGSYYSEIELCNSTARLASKDKLWKEEDPNYPKSPWWYTGEEGLGAGMRLVRPYKIPATQAEKLAVWDADLDSIIRDAKNRIDSNGRGAIGIVDRRLAEDIAKIQP